MNQRQNHERLALGKSIALSPLQRYYLLPSSWLSKWKSYVTASGKSAASVTEPETLSNVIDLLKCEKVRCNLVDVVLSYHSGTNCHMIVMPVTPGQDNLYW